MLKDNALITFTELQKAFPNSSTSKQDYYEDLINGASAIAEKITKRKLKGRDYSLTLDGTGTSKIVIPDYPVNSVTSVNVDEGRVFSAETELAENEYGVYEDNGIIVLFDSEFPKLPLIVKITLNAGFTEIPEDIKIAIMEIVNFLHSRRNSNLIGVKSKNLDTGISETWETSIPYNALQILNRYIKRW